MSVEQQFNIPVCPKALLADKTLQSEASSLIFSSSPSVCFPACSRAIRCSDYALQEINMLLAFTGIIILRLYNWYVFILLTSAQNSQHPSTANREWPCCPWSGSVQWMLTPGLLLDRFHFPFYFVLTSFHPWKLHFSWRWMNELGSIVSTAAVTIPLCSCPNKLLSSCIVGASSDLAARFQQPLRMCL